MYNNESKEKKVSILQTKLQWVSNWRVMLLFLLHFRWPTVSVLFFASMLSYRWYAYMCVCIFAFIYSNWSNL